VQRKSPGGGTGAAKEGVMSLLIESRISFDHEENLNCRLRCLHEPDLFNSVLPWRALWSNLFSSRDGIEDFFAIFAGIEVA
jgi:hypothetical protein